MRRLFAVVLSALLVAGFAPSPRRMWLALTPAPVPVSSNEPLRPPQIRPKLAEMYSQHLVVTMDFPI